MRPGAKGLIKVLAGVALCGVLAVVWIVRAELGTIKAGDPISWAMADASKLSVFFWGFGTASAIWALVVVVVGTAMHFWWPARRAYARVWQEVKDWGDPETVRDHITKTFPLHEQEKVWMIELEQHATHLYKTLSVVLLLLLLAAPARAADQPYVELYATSGLLFNEHVNEAEEAQWVKSEYLGLKAIGRLPLRYNLALVGRGEIKGMPSSFAYNKPESFTGLAGDLGLSWTPVARQQWAVGGLVTYGEVWNLQREDAVIGRYSSLGGGLVVRHEPTRSWVAAGVIACRFYGAGALPRLVLHAGLLPATALEADLIWGDAPSVALSLNVGWKR